MSQEIPTQLSTVTESLPPVAKVRYIEKLRLCNLPACPYGIPDYLFKRGLSQVEAVVPQMSPHDIYVYLIFGLSTLSEESLQAWKSLEALSYHSNGWIGDVAFFDIQDKNVLVKGKVCHSQSLNGDPLKPWVVCTPSGKILATHCDCKAG